MPDFAVVVKRALVGRPMRSERLGETLLPKRIALPVFASDALSSVAYAPDEILLTLALAGTAALVFSPWVGLAVVAVMLVVVLSYRQNVHAYPSGGGDYEVVTTNLGPTAGITVASALLVDYVLTVAVSISSGAQYLASALPVLAGHEVAVAVVVIVALALVNLRGVRESGTAFAIPTYLYMGVLGLLVAVGAVRELAGTLGDAPSAALELTPAATYDAGLTGLAGAFLVLRAFSSGCAALTGIEAISNGVPAFERPKSRNAATTLLALGGIAAVMLLGVIWLSVRTGVRFVEDPATQLLADGAPVGEGYHQQPAIVQLAETVFAGLGPLIVLTAAVTGLILLLAANTAFNGFPLLASVLARDGFLPKQLHSRGDRLVYSNGIIVLALGAIVLVIAFDAQVTRLIQLYIVGVFVSLTLSQLGMIRHWTRHLRTETDRAARTTMVRSRVINTVGLAMTGTVLVVVVITKFTHGAWITLLIMGGFFLLMNAIRRHYARITEDLALTDYTGATALPSRVHAVVLVSKVHEPTLRAVAYARATRPSSIEAVTVDIDRDATLALRKAWLAARVPVPLTVLATPYREITRPIMEHVRSVRRSSPRDVVVVYVPEYVVSHWWERLLHNQTALWLKSRLLFTPGVVIASVPFQLHQDDRLDAPVPMPVPLDARPRVARHGH